LCFCLGLAKESVAAIFTQNVCWGRGWNAVWRNITIFTGAKVNREVISHVLAVLGHVTEAAGGSEKVVVMGTALHNIFKMLRNAVPKSSGDRF
jgi:hypothetical protein